MTHTDMIGRDGRFHLLIPGERVARCGHDPEAWDPRTPRGRAVPVCPECLEIVLAAKRAAERPARHPREDEEYEGICPRRVCRLRQLPTGRRPVRPRAGRLE